MIESYVINLEKDFERKEALLKNIKQHNVDNYINFNFIKAIDQSSFSQYEFKICDTWFDRYLKTGITVGEVGCALSHYKCWNDFYNSNKEHAIIFEDDVEFTEDFYEKLQILLKYPPDADIVYIHRKPLNVDEETVFDNNFINIKASYWLCGYLLTRKGVEKILKTNYLDNLIVVDEFLPVMYDNEYLPIYKSYYNNIQLIGYGIHKSFILLRDCAFLQSNTYHSNYYKYDNKFTVITSDSTTSLSAMDRFIYSCEKYSLNHLIINNVENMIESLNTIDENKIIIISNSNYSFFIGNPLDIYLKDKDYIHGNFHNFTEFITAYKNNNAYFYGKNSILKSILKENNLMNDFTIQTNIFIKNLLNNDKNISADDFIIVNGISNPLLLNKYENYILRKVHGSYGFKITNKKPVDTFKIRVNILSYESNYITCLKHIKNIDYPSHLLDIHIYTEQECNREDCIQIHKVGIYEAYKDMYNHYNDYDYIWLINSNYIINEYSLLKNCISTNKNISSGLQKSKNKFLSNFWGDISKDGWYSRSDDYFDIINLKKQNLWNIPYINGNILIKSSVFKKYNMFKVINYNINHDMDMIFCENLRLNNEGIYLLNDKVYGYICEKLPDLPNWSEESILHTDFYNFLYNNKKDIFNEVGTDIWNIPFFSPEFCKYLIQIAEKKNTWSSGIYTDQNTVDSRINAVENVPTQDIHLVDLGLHNFWTHVVSKYFNIILDHLYNYKVKNYHIAFIVKYNADNGQTSLKPHHDASVYTINIALNSDDEYTGGGVNFLKKNCLFVNKNPGYLLLHPGRVTHRHEALPITSGKRYILVSFNN